MSTQLPIAYLNGEFLALDQARISPLDRGFLFGEGVYEVIPVYAGQALQLDAHLTRLGASLRMIGLVQPEANLRATLTTLIDANGGGDLSIYLQITRGVAHGVRNHSFPAQFTPTVFAMCQSLEPRADDVARSGVAAITLTDERWARCDIKSTSLLANTIARETARAAQAAEAILLRDGCVTEGAASSVFVVRDGKVSQPPPEPAILPGTTAPFVVDLLKKDGVATTFETISETQLRAADEIWLTSSTREALPVTTLDGQSVGPGVPGPLWQRLDALYQRAKRATDPT